MCPNYAGAGVRLTTSEVVELTGGHASCASCTRRVNVASFEGDTTARSLVGIGAFGLVGLLVGVPAPIVLGLAFGLALAVLL